MSDDSARIKGLRTFPPPARGFDLAAASERELKHHGIPRKPDASQEPGLTAIWEDRARRYREFEHLEPRLIPSDAVVEPTTSNFTLSPSISAGFELFSPAPITVFTGSWTVPNLTHTQGVNHPLNFRTFFGLGFLDVHVEMTVDPAQNVTAVVWVHTGAQVSIAVRPGDVMSAVLCLQTNATGTAFYGIVNETTGQTVNFSLDTHFPAAVRINAGVSRGSAFNGPPDPLARFGTVYFDDLVAYSTGGTRVLTNGVATTMVDRNGVKLATPYRLNDQAFKVVFND